MNTSVSLSFVAV